ISAIPFLAQSQSKSSEPSAYANPSSCSGCHQKIAESYGKTGMARSFAKASPQQIGDLRNNNRFDHAPSETHFAMLERDGKFFERRWQTGYEGKATNFDELQIDYVMGSGNHGRTFIHREKNGALQQLPLGWYAEKGGTWGMNPGYDRPD